jgi:hypothetical protein
LLLGAETLSLGYLFGCLQLEQALALGGCPHFFLMAALIQAGIQKS